MKDLYKLLNARGQGLEELSFGTKVPMENLRKIADGVSKPSLGEVRKIAQFFNISLESLLGDSEIEKNVGILFRKTLSNKEEAKVHSQLESAIQKIKASSLLSRESATAVEWQKFFKNINIQTFEGASQAAAFFRELICEDDQLSPLLNLPSITSDALGIFLFILKGDEFEGASTIFAEKKFIFLSPRFQPRMLFTLAHELGHILVHHGVKEFFSYDRDVFDVSQNSQDRTEEAFANAFASCLLMPEKGVGMTLKKIRDKIQSNNNDQLGDVEILFLSRFYGVSFLAAGIRCEQLKLLPSGGASALNAKLKDDHRSAERRAEELGLPNRPEIDFRTSDIRLLNDAIDKVRGEELSIGRAIELLNIGIEDIYAYNNMVH